MTALAFAAVYREGFETVLFYQALAFDAGVGAILLGFVPGMILIVLIGIGIIRMNAKLPLRKVFAWTNAVLMYLAFVFIGKGIYNLQEGGLFSATPLPLPDHPALRQLLGFYPVMQTVMAQAAFLLLIGLTYLWYRKKMKAAAEKQIEPNKTRVVA
jgi:high-affinity iron transporter